MNASWVAIGLLLSAGCGGGASSDCPGDQVRCEGACVNLSRSAAHCGACGAPCGAGDTCADGACRPAACPDGLTDCGAVCVDLSRDPRNCGACRNACPTDQVCDGAGACAPDCATATIACGRSCVDDRSDDAHCGGCFTPCLASEQCVTGRCLPACVGTEIRCGDRCVDVVRDDASCGGCPGEGAVCTGSQSCWSGACRTRGDAVFTTVLFGRREVADEWARSIDADAEANVVVGGAAAAGDRDFFRAMIDVRGAVVWEAREDLGGFDELHAVAFTPSGDVVVGGWRTLVDPVRTALFVHTLAPDGGARWPEPLVLERGTGALARDLAVDPSGDLFVAGDTSDGGDFDSLIARLRPDGSVVWIQVLDVLGSGRSERAHGVAIDEAGDAYFVGTSQASSGDIDAWLLKVDGAGDPLWTRRVARAVDDQLYAVALDGAGHLYAVGSWGQDGVATGVAIYRYRVDGAPDGFDHAAIERGENEAFSVAVDREGTAVVVGQTGTRGGGLDAFVRALDPDDLGTARWADVLSGPRDDSFVDVVVDRHGDVVVTGYSENDRDRDVWVRKYAN